MRVNKISFYGLEFNGRTTFLVAEFSIETDYDLMCIPAPGVLGS